MPTAPSRLSRTLIPILTDRKVPEANLHGLFRASLEYEEKSMLNAAGDPQLLHQWVYSKASFLEIERTNSETEWLGSLPFLKPNVTLFLLEHGFVPEELPYLADIVRDLMKKYLTRIQKFLNPRIGRSTYVLAVADPIGCLRPGEVHLAFSEKFVDQQSGFCDMMLHDVEVVVARQPALRGSDIQKVRAVFMPELRRLLDVVIFPSKGIFPLAERMGNGDYDGDMFWVCWEPGIVRDFRNTPSPTHLPKPKSLGIQTVDDAINDNFMHANREAIRGFLDLNFDFRCQDDLLGICTDFRDRFVYKAGSIQSQGVEVLDDLHDLLVDSSKMGYLFTGKSWWNLRKSDPRFPLEYPEKPFYKQLIEGVPPERVTLPRQKNTIAQIFRDVIMPTTKRIITKVQLLFESKRTRDGSLCGPLMVARQLAQAEPSHNEELESLENGIVTVYRTWIGYTSGRLKSSTNEDSDNLGYIEICHENFRKLQPITDIWQIRHETQSLARSSPTDWDLLKASFVYFKNHGGAFSFRMEGRELGFLKAWSAGNPRTITTLSYANMRPKRIKNITTQQDDIEE
jgi:hypothetical protein